MPEFHLTVTITAPNRAAADEIRSEMACAIEDEADCLGADIFVGDIEDE